MSKRRHKDIIKTFFRHRLLSRLLRKEIDLLFSDNKVLTIWIWTRNLYVYILVLDDKIFIIFPPLITRILKASSIFF